MWGQFVDPGPQGTEGVSYRLRSLPHHMSISFVSASNLTSLWAVVGQLNEKYTRDLHAYREWQSQSHPLLLKPTACKHLIWLQSTGIVLFPIRRRCSWSFQPTDFDRRPWWERSIAFSRSKRNRERYRKNWDVCLSLSKRIHSLASAWRKAMSIHQALKEDGAFLKVA